MRCVRRELSERGRCGVSLTGLRIAFLLTILSAFAAGFALLCFLGTSGISWGVAAFSSGTSAYINGRNVWDELTAREKREEAQ